MTATSEYNRLPPVPVRPAHRQHGHIQIVGHIWWPHSTPCATERSLTDYDIGNIEQPYTRDTVLDWIYLHIGDFREITDFYAVVDGVEIPWKDEDNEFVFIDCMYPSETEDYCEGEDE